MPNWGSNAPSGVCGEKLVFEIDMRGTGHNGASIAAVGAIEQAVFPLLTADSESTRPALALKFSPAYSRLDRYRSLSSRAVDLIRRGHTRLVIRAAARRVTRLVARLTPGGA